MRYCAWVGKQVPTSAQWEYAAGHDPETGRDLAYPWGDQWLPRRAACQADGCTPKQPRLDGDLPVGSFDGTRGNGDASSPWGVHDMAGGASELVFDCDDPNTTCMPGGRSCPCRKLLTSTQGTDSQEELKVTHRFDNPGVKSGVIAVRCVRLR